MAWAFDRRGTRHVFRTRLEAIDAKLKLVRWEPSFARWFQREDFTCSQIRFVPTTLAYVGDIACRKRC